MSFRVKVMFGAATAVASVKLAVITANDEVISCCLLLTDTHAVTQWSMPLYM